MVDPQEDEEALSFYLCSPKRWLVNGEEASLGWSRQVVYAGKHYFDLGHGGGMFFFKLSDGRVLLTNDLWDDSHRREWLSSVPKNAFIGHKLATKVCQLKSKDAIAALLDLVDEHGSRFGNFTIQRGILSDERAYALRELGLPEITPRKYSSDSCYARFSSCEGARLTHVKIGKKDVEPLKDCLQLSEGDPAIEPVFLLYEEDSCSAWEFGLQKGDTIDVCYIRDMPEWTEGRYTV